MTTLAEARKSCCDRLLAQWLSSGQARTRIVFDNELFDTKANQSSDWLWFQVRQTGAQQDTLGPTGARRFLRFANVVGQLYTPTEGGVAAVRAGGLERADSHAVALLAIFEAVTFDGLHFNGAGQIREGGHDGRWVRTVVTVPFFYEEIL